MSIASSTLGFEQIQQNDTGVDPSKDPRLLGKNIPSSKDIPSAPKDIRKDADQIVKWVREHIQYSSANREHLERLWVRAESYMDGFHYFTLDMTGIWRSLPKRRDEIRATVPHLRGIYRRELGRFTENTLTVQAFPKSYKNPSAFYKANRAEVMVNAWQDETDFADVFADHASQLIYYGLSGLYRFVDKFRKQAFVEAWPAWELHPLPWNANKDTELQGFFRVKLMPKDWIEQNIGERAAKLAGKSARIGTRVGGMSAGRGASGNLGGKAIEAGEVVWGWLLPTQEIPSGMKFLIVEDEMFGFQSTDEKGNPITGELATGVLPIEFSRYTNQQNSWYGMGALPTALGSQAEADRSWSKIVRSSRLKDGILFYDDSVVDKDDMFNDDMQMIPYGKGTYGVNEKFFDIIPPIPSNSDVGATLGLADDMGKKAIGHESDILFGKAEGRVESGPAARILNVNAQAPIAPTFGRLKRALVKTYSGILDMISEVWPDDKKISVIGQYELPNEITLSREDRPASSDIIFRPAPLLPSGRAEMVNILFQLRNMVSDTNTPMITDAEFRRGLIQVGMQPPGMKFVNLQDQRIRQKVGLLFNDGKTPGDIISDQFDMVMLSLEDNKAFTKALIDKMLEPGFRTSASNEVKKAFLKVLQTLRDDQLEGPRNAERFDENLDGEAFDAQKMEETLDAVEQDPTTVDGQFQQDGLPV